HRAQVTPAQPTRCVPGAGGSAPVRPNRTVTLPCSCSIRHGNSRPITCHVSCVDSSRNVEPSSGHPPWGRPLTRSPSLLDRSHTPTTSNRTIVLRLLHSTG